MVDLESEAPKQLGIMPCAGIVERKTRPTVAEYTAAELWIRHLFVDYWKATAGSPQAVIWQLQWLFGVGGAAEPEIEEILSTLESDFRNPIPDRWLKQFLKLVRGGAPLPELEKFLAEAPIGGLRKPDMLGISAAKGVLFEGVEVGTVSTAQATYSELRDKLNKLELIHPQLITRLNKRMAPQRTFTPAELMIRPSPFRVASERLTCPLPTSITPTANGYRIEWICFHPSTSWYPPGQRPAPTAPDPRGTDGLFIYHIHQADLSKQILPKDIQEPLNKALENWILDREFVLELNPALRAAALRARSQWNPESTRMMGYVGLGALAMLGVTAAIIAYPAVVAAAGTAAESALAASLVRYGSAGVAALSSSPDALARAMSSAARMSDEFMKLGGLMPAFAK